TTTRVANRTPGESILAPQITSTEQQSVSVVVLGRFNPAIFQPQWFALNALVPREEANTAEVAVVHPQFTSFDMGQMHIQVESGKFAITSKEFPQWPILRDLALGTLTLLEHTPLSAIGLNADTLLVLESEEVWHQVGHGLVPKQPWNDVLEKPGMHDLVVQ